MVNPNNQLKRQKEKSEEIMNPSCKIVEQRQLGLGVEFQKKTIEEVKSKDSIEGESQQSISDMKGKRCTVDEYQQLIREINIIV